MHLFDKQLNIAFKLLFIICLSLLSVRFFNTISFLEPLHVQTGGAEDTSFIGIWYIKNGILGYDHFLKFNIDISNPNIFSLFHYNWLFYHLNSFSVIISQKLFNLSDLWLPTIVRINCFILSFFSFWIFCNSLNLLNKNKLSFFFSFFLIFGPLTGYWVISGKPDIFYIFFEILAIYTILRTQNNRNYLNITIILVLLYFSWSIKQTSIVTISSFAFYLLWRKRFNFFVYITFVFSIFLVLTKILGPHQLFESIFWQGGAAISLNFNHFFKIFLDSLSKGLIVYAGLFCISINIFLKNNISSYYKSLNENQVFLIIGILFSTSQILFSFHYGSAVNYYYPFFIYSGLFLFSEIDNLVKNKNLSNLLLSSVYIQIVLIFFVFIGIKGSTSPIKYKNIKEFKKCVYDLKAPILSDHKPYYRLPWITPDNNPILITMMYENYIKDLNFEDTPVYKEVKKGSFETLIISERNKYNLEKYTLERKCNSLYGAKVKIYIKNQ